MVSKIMVSVPDEVLHKDLEKYRNRALELGAADAKITTTDMILIDERVRLKCIVPLCSSYGTNANCPPYAIALDLIRKMVNNFRYAIFIRLKVPSEELCGTGYKEKRLAARSALKNFQIVSKIESEAFYDGYHLATGFGGGPCKLYFCPEHECTALVPGQPCRHALQARVSMEGAGMNAFAMAARAGWDIYAIGCSAQPSEVPCGARLGLVLIY